jgi:hypothetical protein
MSIERHMSADLYGALNERLRTSDKQAEIDLCYELISSGHSVGEILAAATSAGHEVAISSDELKPLRSAKFPRIARWIALGVVYTAVVSSVSIAGFSIMRGGRDAEPTTTYVQPNASSTIEDVVIPSPVVARSEPVPELLIPGDQVRNADPAHVSEPSQTAEPDSTLSDPALKAEAGVQVAAVAGRPEAAASQESELGQPDEMARLIEQLDHQAAKILDSAHQPIPLAAHLPAAASAGLAETALQSDAAHSDAGQPLDVRHRDAAKASATMPTGKISAASPSRAHATKTRKASASRRYSELKRRVPQQTLARYPQPVSNGQPPGSYTNSFRGYGYGGPAPNSDTGG